MLTTCGTVVRRVGHQEVNRATGAYIAKVVQGALVGCVARGEMPTSGAGGLLIVTAIKSQLGCWEVLDVDNALGGVWYVSDFSVSVSAVPTTRGNRMRAMKVFEI